MPPGVAMLKLAWVGIAELGIVAFHLSFPGLALRWAARARSIQANATRQNRMVNFIGLVLAS